MSKVSVVSCGSYNEKEVLDSLKLALSKIDFDIRPNLTVFLKPNVFTGVSPDKAITTHPKIVDAVCNLLKNKNCKIIIGESCGLLKGDTMLEALEKAGIAEVARKYNAKLINLDAEKLVKKRNTMAIFDQEIFLPEILFKVDLIINLPKLKTHSFMIYTGAVKNLYGCITGGRKKEYHARANTKEKFANLLLDIWQNIRPQLNIMDGVIGMEGEGPTNGDIVHPKLILASDNAIALDLIAEKIVGFDNEIPTNTFALKRNLIRKEDILVGEIPSYKLKKPKAGNMPSFRSLYLLKKIRAYPVANKLKCKRCWTCVNMCPVGAMEQREYPYCNKSKCIACYCCQEKCHFNAIELKQDPIFAKLTKAYHNYLKLRDKITSRFK